MASSVSIFAMLKQAPSHSTCLGSFFWVSGRQLRCRPDTQKNSEYRKQEKLQTKNL
ncbi:hypothetical protein SAMN05443633_11515 [Chryseobacterium arachidis]|uniref:Uncharacterized protein n=1 Tax=Chryseobacterium arachidis TaxID=1416778 RepID=A0A1M5JMK4_9FLAO|nr:hypothetical protein SAMN05443633_11515 [Chryseobacterium arachidis]